MTYTGPGYLKLDLKVDSFDGPLSDCIDWCQGKIIGRFHWIPNPEFHAAQWKHTRCSCIQSPMVFYNPSSDWNIHFFQSKCCHSITMKFMVCVYKNYTIVTKLLLHVATHVKKISSF